MKTIEINSMNIQQWEKKPPNHVIALGFFDGLHKGHQQVIQKAKEEANSKNLSLSVMSFFPHPKSVLSKGKAKVDYLMPLEEKKRHLKEMGVDYFFIVEFSLDFASLSPEHFVSNYLIDLGAVHAVCGFDYTYGKKGAGNVTTLIEHGQGKLDVTIVPKVNLCGEKISSTRIRHLLSEGKMTFISELLGKPYAVEWHTQNGLHPFYTLPAIGSYEVIVECARRKQETIVHVTSQMDIDFDNIEMPIDEDFKIMWLREVAVKKYRAIS